MLSDSQIELYEQQGYLLIENVLSNAQVREMQAQISRITAGAKGLTENNEVFDLEDSHQPENPRVRRIKKPHAISPFFSELVRDPRITDLLSQLIGPNLRLQNSKLNLKSAGYGAPVEWHQDWAFYPHTNDDVVAIGIMVHDVDEANGPLMVLPGSHKGPIYDHHCDGVFCGAIDPQSPQLDLSQAVQLTGPAGSMSIHHVRLVHGSAQNRSGRDRGLLLYEVAAADAWPLAGIVNPPFTTLEEYDSRIILGRPSIEPRLEQVPVRIPQPVTDVTSIYQAQKSLSRKYFTPDVEDVSTGL